MGSVAYMELVYNPKYQKFLHQTFPQIGTIGQCHHFMISLIDAAQNYRSAFSEFRSGYFPWTVNPWVSPLISRNTARLTLKLGRLIRSIFKYARPDWKVTYSDWCEAYFDNHCI